MWIKQGFVFKMEKIFTRYNTHFLIAFKSNLLNKLRSQNKIILIPFQHTIASFSGYC